MRLLADENLDASIVQWLRDEGHDVFWIAETCPGMGDIDIANSAEASGRIVISRDKDFGSLAIRTGVPAVGVILLRIRARTQQMRLAVLQQLWPEILESATNNFVTVSNDRVRTRKIKQ